MFEYVLALMGKMIRVNESLLYIREFSIFVLLLETNHSSQQRGSPLRFKGALSNL